MPLHPKIKNIAEIHAACAGGYQPTIAGSIKTRDGSCRSLAYATGCIVVSVE